MKSFYVVSKQEKISNNVKYSFFKNDKDQGECIIALSRHDRHYTSCAQRNSCRVK